MHIDFINYLNDYCFNHSGAVSGKKQANSNHFQPPTPTLLKKKVFTVELILFHTKNPCFMMECTFTQSK